MGSRPHMIRKWLISAVNSASVREPMLSVVTKTNFAVSHMRRMTGMVRTPECQVKDLNLRVPWIPIYSRALSS